MVLGDMYLNMLTCFLVQTTTHLHRVVLSYHSPRDRNCTPTVTVPFLPLLNRGERKQHVNTSRACHKPVPLMGPVKYCSAWLNQTPLQAFKFSAKDRKKNVLHFIMKCLRKVEQIFNCQLLLLAFIPKGNHISGFSHRVTKETLKYCCQKHWHRM